MAAQGRSVSRETHVTQCNLQHPNNPSNTVCRLDICLQPTPRLLVNTRSYDLYGLHGIRLQGSGRERSVIEQTKVAQLLNVAKIHCERKSNVTHHQSGFKQVWWLQALCTQTLHSVLACSLVLLAHCCSGLKLTACFSRIPLQMYRRPHDRGA